MYDENIKTMCKLSTQPGHGVLQLKMQSMGSGGACLMGLRELIKLISEFVEFFRCCA